MLLLFIDKRWSSKDRVCRAKLALFGYSDVQNSCLACGGCCCLFSCCARRRIYHIVWFICCLVFAVRLLRLFHWLAVASWPVDDPLTLTANLRIISHYCSVHFGSCTNRQWTTLTFNLRIFPIVLCRYLRVDLLLGHSGKPISLHYYLLPKLITFGFSDDNRRVELWSNYKRGCVQFGESRFILNVIRFALDCFRLDFVVKIIRSTFIILNLRILSL